MWQMQQSGRTEDDFCRSFRPAWAGQSHVTLYKRLLAILLYIKLQGILIRAINA
jgi:hypothetical protein